MESRWVDLEIKIAYQERWIQELNEVVIAQQKKIDDLQKALLRVEQLVQQNHTQMTATGQEAPPPHY